MLDIQFIRQNTEAVKRAILQKGMNVDIDRLLLLDDRRRDLQRTLDECRHTQHLESKRMPNLSGENREAALKAMTTLKETLKTQQEELDGVFSEWQLLMDRVPNIPAADTPVDPTGAQKKVIRSWGDPSSIKGIKDHITLGKELDIIDTERGTVTAGFRGYYLKNEGVMLHLGIMVEAMQLMKSRGFTLMIPPTILRAFALRGSGHFPFFNEEVYSVADTQDDPLYLAGTSEPSLLAYYADTILSEEELPKKLCGFSPCYRSEVGSYGKDTRGLYRVHEFMKAEQVVIMRPHLEEGERMFEEMSVIAETLLKKLGLPHRVVQLSTGDMGPGKYRMWDIETWMPSRAAFGETHSNSFLTDWQARRLNIRIRDALGKAGAFAYTLNNTVIASPRILIALLENGQEQDGSVRIPDILQHWVGADRLHPKATAS